MENNYSDVKNEICNNLETPMTLGNWIGTMLLMMIPIVNIVLMFVWAFSSKTNKSKKTYFQANLILMGILIAVYTLIVVSIIN